MSPAPKAAPSLPGFQLRSHLGSGGFADVYLYHQDGLEREVAVKVLREAVSDATRSDFLAEAKLMASVSEHPYIVTVYLAGVADDGRPYIVMESYPRPHFGLRMRERGLAVAETLRVGIQLASAVETAHRAGILHRDIKPPNVLASRYDRPGLTDFGIAGARADGSAAQSLGFSTAWAPPEVLLDTSPGDERSDVYSLAATIYAFLAGRSPHERPGGDNGRAAMTTRVLNETSRPTGRSDVPVGLEHLLRQAMSKDPDDRPSSAAAFARSLQSIQRELQLDVTPLELGEEVLPGRRADDDGEDSTRLGTTYVVDPDGVTGGGGSVTDTRGRTPIDRVPDSPTGRDGARRERTPVDDRPGVDATKTVVRGGASRPAPIDPVVEPSPEASRSSRLPLVAGGAVVALVAIGGAFALAGGGGDDDRAATTDTVVADDGGQLIILGPPVAPDGVVVTVSGTDAEVDWSPVDGEPVDYFVVTRDARSDTETSVQADAPPVVLTDVVAGEQVCVEVTAVRDGQASEPSPVVCATGGGE